MRTPTDTKVRDTWEIPREAVTVRWAARFEPVPDELRELLGLPATCTLRAELHSMLVYSLGQLTGGYAGAKATVRFVAGYAADESTRAGLGIRFLSLLPDLTSETGLGGAAVEAYARRLGVDAAEFVRRRGPEQLSPEQVGAAVLDLARGKGENGEAYSLTAQAFEQLG